MRTSPWIACLFALVACSKFEVRSTRVPGVPAALLGEWHGSWTSSRTGTSSAASSGAVTLKVQQFDGQPVIDLAIDNPCLVPRSYDLVMAGTGIDLRADGVTVFHAEIPEPGVLRGYYACAEDEGQWTADWQQDLPAIQDLSGTWNGSLVHSPGVTEALALNLTQNLQGGVLRLSGTLNLPGLLPVSLPLEGAVHFREGAFDVVLATPSGVAPAVRMAGVGDAVTSAIDDGLLLSDASVLLPFTTALWDAAPVGQ